MSEKTIGIQGLTLNEPLVFEQGAHGVSKLQSLSGLLERIWFSGA